MNRSIEHSTDHPADESLALHAGGDLPPEEAAYIEAHAASCSSCGRTLAGLRAGGAGLALLAADDARPPSPAEEAALARLRAGVLGGVERIESERRSAASHPPRWALAAALLMALLAAAVWWRSDHSADPDDQAAPADRTVEVAAPDPVSPVDGDTSPGDEHPTAPTRDRAQAPTRRPPVDRAPSGPSHRSAAPPARTDALASAGSATPEAASPNDPSAAGVSETPTAESPITIRVVSDDPDIVFYWLVDEPEENRDDDESS